MAMKLQRTVAFAATSLVALALVSGCAPSGEPGGPTGSGESATLTYTTFVGENGYTGTVAKDWMDAVTEASDGRITFRATFSGSLCSTEVIVACVQDGRTDIGTYSASFSPADFPISGLGNLPFQTLNGAASVVSMQRLYEENEALQAEFANINQHPLLYGIADPPILGYSKPLGGVEDLQGARLRVAGPLGLAMEELGVSPVPVPTLEQYDAVQRGVIDGTVTSLEAQVDGSLQEVLKDFYDIGQYTGTASMIITSINDDAWNSLPEDLQNVLKDVSADYLELQLQDLFTDAVTDQCTRLLDADATLSPLGPEDELENWAKRWKSTMVETWASDAAAAGVEDPQAIADQRASLLEEEEKAHQDFKSGAEICMSIQDEKR